MDDEHFRHCDLESILKDPSAQPYDLRLQYLRDITDDFSTERELGRGGFGVVYKVIFHFLFRTHIIRVIQNNIHINKRL